MVWEPRRLSSTGKRMRPVWVGRGMGKARRAGRGGWGRQECVQSSREAGAEGKGARQQASQPHLEGEVGRDDGRQPHPIQMRRQNVWSLGSATHIY